jgi:hypothetical protein
VTSHDRIALPDRYAAPATFGVKDFSPLDTWPGLGHIDLQKGEARATVLTVRKWAGTDGRLWSLP